MIDVANQKAAETSRNEEELYRLLSRYYGRVVEVEVCDQHEGQPAEVGGYSRYARLEIPSEIKVTGAIGRLTGLGLEASLSSWLTRADSLTRSLSVEVGSKQLSADSIDKIRVSVLDEASGSWRLVHSPSNWKELIEALKTNSQEDTQ